MHISHSRKKGALMLFESFLKKPYTDRGARKILERYSKIAGFEKNISPYKFRHFLLLWFKKEGIEDSFLCSYSGLETLQPLRVYSQIDSEEIQQIYEEKIKNFPI